MHPSRVLPALRRARFWREFLSALLFVSLLLPAHAAAPQWWAQRGVIAPDKARDDFAAINQGQLKNLAAKAVAEMNAKLIGGAGTALNQRVASWSANTAQADDFAGVNIGQAKAVARPVYERLLAAGAITALPSWITTPAASNQDFAAANIGQVKNLFAFEVPDQVGTTGTDSTNPETGPGLPANSPFVISYHGWRSGSLTPDLDNTATVDTTGKVGFIRRYRWALTWGAETKPEKKLVSTHNEFLPTETDQESWKNDNTTSAESYRKIVTIMEPIYSDPENSSSILTQVKEHLRTYNIHPSGESYTDQFVASHFSTADKNMALQRNGQTTYEVTEGTWTEAECQSLTVGQAPPPHFFKQEAHGPTPPAASNWTAAVPTVVSNPETILQSPGAEIPYDSLILPSTGELLATADSILEKKVAYFRNSEGNFTSSERHIGKKSTGRIKIAWRTDLSPPLTTEQKKAWLSHFKVVTKNNYQYSGQPLNTHSSTVPLTQYLGVNSTQAVEIAHLSPQTQMGYQAHIELSLVPTSFVPPGTDPTPNPAEPDIGPPPPGKLVLFTRQKEVKASAGSTSSAPSSFGILKLDESQPLSATSVVYLKKTTLRTQFVSIVEDTPLPEDISRPIYDSGEAIGTETIVHTGDIKDTYFNDYSFSESQEWINPIRIVPQPPNSFSEPNVQTQVERKHDRSRTKMRDVTISTQINTTSNILNTVRSTTITNLGYSLLDESSFAHDIKDVPGDSPPLVYTGEQSVNEFSSETKSWTKSWVDGEGNSRNESGGSTITYPTVSNQGTLTSLISEHSVFPDTDSVVDYDTPTRGGYSISLVDRGQVVGRSENSTELSVPLPWTSVDAAMRTQLAERPYPEWVRKGDVTSLSQIGQSVYECQFHPGEFSSKGSMLSWYLKHEAPTGTSAAQKAAMPPLTRLVYLLYKNPTGVKVHEEIKTLTVAPDQKSTVFEASALTDDLLPEGGTVTVSLLPIEVNSRDRAVEGFISNIDPSKPMKLGFTSGSKSYGTYEIPQSGSSNDVHVYDSVDDIFSDSEAEQYKNGSLSAKAWQQQVVLVREGNGVRFYTVADNLSEFKATLYSGGKQIGEVKHQLTEDKDFGRVIAAANGFIKGDEPPRITGWSSIPTDITPEPPPVPALTDDQLGDVLASAPSNVASNYATASTATASTTTTQATATSISANWHTDPYQFGGFVLAVKQSATESEWASFTTVLQQVGYDPAPLLNNAATATAAEAPLADAAGGASYANPAPSQARNGLTMPSEISNRGLVSKALMWIIKKTVLTQAAVGEGVIFGMWDGIKGDVEGVVDLLTLQPLRDFIQFVKDPYRAAGELYKIFRYLKDNGWEGVKTAATSMLQEFMGQQQARLECVLGAPDVEDPTYLNPYLAGYAVGFIGEQVVVAVFTAGVGKVGWIAKAFEMGSGAATKVLQLAGNIGSKMHKVSKGFFGDVARVGRSADEIRATRRSASLCGSVTGCLAAGTLVLMADGSYQPIQTLRHDALVMAGDPYDNEPPKPARVRSQIETHNTTLLDIRYADAATLTCTVEHPFYAVNRGWVMATDLRSGDQFIAPDARTFTVNSVTERSGQFTTYNLDVDGPDTFFVTPNSATPPILTHNLQGEEGMYGYLPASGQIGTSQAFTPTGVPRWNADGTPLMMANPQHHFYFDAGIKANFTDTPLVFTHPAQTRPVATVFPSIELTHEQHVTAHMFGDNWLTNNGYPRALQMTRDDWLRLYGDGKWNELAEEMVRGANTKGAGITPDKIARLKNACAGRLTEFNHRKSCAGL